MKIQILFLIAFSQLLASNKLVGQDKSEISPLRSVEKKIIKGKNDYVYYTLTQKEATTFRVVGPGKLLLNFRLNLDANGSTKKSSIKIVQSQSLVKTYEISELTTDSQKSSNNEILSQMHRIEIEVPPGMNTYRLYSTDKNQIIHVRGFYTAYPKPQWEDLMPVNNPEKREVQFSTSKKVQEYYLVTKKQGVQFVITDTCQLRIIIRPAFNNKMLDDAKINVILTNINTGELKTYKFSSKRGNDVEFVNDTKSVPGKSTTFYVSLPKPKEKNNTYEVLLVDGAKFGAVRISKNKKLKK